MSLQRFVDARRNDVQTVISLLYSNKASTGIWVTFYHVTIILTCSCNCTSLNCYMKCRYEGTNREKERLVWG